MSEPKNPEFADRVASSLEFFLRRARKAIDSTQDATIELLRGDDDGSFLPGYYLEQAKKSLGKAEEVLKGVYQIVDKHNYAKELLERQNPAKTS